MCGERGALSAAIGQPAVAELTSFSAGTYRRFICHETPKFFASGLGLGEPASRIMRLHEERLHSSSAEAYVPCFRQTETSLSAAASYRDRVRLAVGPATAAAPTFFPHLPMEFPHLKKQFRGRHCVGARLLLLQFGKHDRPESCAVHRQSEHHAG